MQTAGDRFLNPLTAFFLAFLLAGIPGAAGAGSDSGKDDQAAEKQTQASQTQTAPAQTKPAQTRPADAKKQPAEKPLSFTDEDLKRYHSGSAGPSTQPADPAPASEDLLRKFHDQEERSRWRREKIVRMQERILELEGKLKFLEQKRLSIANPYLPRPQEGEGAKEEETGLSGPELLERADAEIKQTSEDLESARKELSAFLEATPE